MPDALSIGGQFVLCKPEGALNYFFYDFHTGERVAGADLARAKILAETQGIAVAGDADKGVLFVKSEDLDAWRNLHPDAPTRSMPDPGPLNKPAEPRLSEPDAITEPLPPPPQLDPAQGRFAPPSTQGDGKTFEVQSYQTQDGPMRPQGRYGSDPAYDYPQQDSFAVYRNAPDVTPETLKAQFTKIGEKFRGGEFANSGTTASFAHVSKDGKLTVANVGDSPVAIYVRDPKTGKVIFADMLSADHSALNEAARIEKEGGVVFGGRVGGQLAISRAMGDNSLKGVSTTPDVRQLDLNQFFDKGYEVVITAESDGALEAHGAEDAVNRLKAGRVNRIGQSSSNLAEDLVKLADSAGSTDNVTSQVMVLKGRPSENVAMAVFDGHGKKGGSASRLAATEFSAEMAHPTVTPAISAKAAPWQETRLKSGKPVARLSIEGMDETQVAALQKELADAGIRAVPTNNPETGKTLRVGEEDFEKLRQWRAGEAKLSAEDMVKRMHSEIDAMKAQGVEKIVAGQKHVVIETPFKGGVLPLELPAIDRKQPAAMFEKQYGLKGIAKEYKYPPGTTAEEVEDYAKVVWHQKLRGEITPEQMEEKLRQVRGMLEDLNPELKAINAGTREMATYDVILGATSGFNPKDMQFFLSGHNTMEARALNPEFVAFERDLTRRGMAMQWVPSPDTMQEISRQISAPGYKLPPGAPPVAATANWQEAVIAGEKRITRLSIEGLSESQVSGILGQLTKAGFHPYQAKSATLGNTLRIPPEELEAFNKWRRGEDFAAPSQNRIIPSGGGNNGPVMSIADDSVPRVEVQLGNMEASTHTYSTPLAEGETLVQRRRAGFTASSDVVVTETAKNTSRRAGFTSDLQETMLDAPLPETPKNTAGFTNNRPRSRISGVEVTAEKEPIGFRPKSETPPRANTGAATTEVAAVETSAAETANAGRTARETTTAATTSRVAETTVVAGEDAAKASRFRALFTPSRSQYTWRLVEAAGGSEKAAARVAGVAKVGGVALKILGPVAGGIMTYRDLKENYTGNSYTKLLEASGLGPDSAPAASYDDFQKKNIVDDVAMTIPAGVTQAYWALSTGLRWAAGDVDHRKLLATIVARANSGTEEGKTKEAVRQYVDSALPWYHYLTAQKQQNVIDNIMAMKNSGKMQDWSQLPGLIGTKGNMLRLQDSPQYFAQNNTGRVVLPDVNKTAAAFYGTDPKTDPGLSPEIAEATKMEDMRKRSQIPDIDWNVARERFEQGGKDAVMNYLSGEMPGNMWKDMKGFFSHALDVLDVDKDFMALRTVYNRPLDVLSQSFVNSMNGAADGEDVNRPVVLDRDGKPRVLTDELLAEIKKIQPDENGSLGYKFLKVEKVDGKNVVTATDLTSEQLDKLQSGEMKLEGAADMMSKVRPRSGVEDSTVKVEDTPPVTLEDLKAKADQIAKAPDQKTKDKLQGEFNDMYMDAGSDTRAKFIDNEKTNAEVAAVDTFVKAKKMARAGKGDDYYGPDENELQGLARGNAEMADLIRMYHTGIDNAELPTSKGIATVRQQYLVADVNRNGVFDGPDKAFLEKYGMANFQVTSLNGQDSVNVVNSKMYGAFIVKDGQYIALPSTDPKTLAELQQSTEAERERQKQAQDAAKAGDGQPKDPPAAKAPKP